MDKKDLVCDLCNVSLGNEKNKEFHVMGKKHQLAMHNAHISKVKEKCGIFVTGLPPVAGKEDEIYEFFGQYGKIVDRYFGNRFAIIQFSEPEVAENLLKTKVIFQGNLLLIKPRTLRDRIGAKFDKQKPSENFDLINNCIKNVSTITGQITLLMNKVQSNVMELNKYMRLCNDLQNILQEIFPGCIVHPFGSTITGLGFKSSDVDVYVQVPMMQSDQKSDLSPAAQYVMSSKKLLLRCPRYFIKVCGIPKAKTPIVKCIHVPTNISCDFNFKNMLGVCNSFLIKYYLSLDENLIPLMIIIKYWAKTHELSGSSGKLSNYSLCMMLIFYLQQEPMSFPSVNHLQSFHNCVNMQESWNGGFNKILNVNLEPVRSYSIVRLLHGFFDFYANFDYSLFVISPFMGRSTPKMYFLKPELLPDSFRLYKSNLKGMWPLKIETPMCVQDPFEHNHNLTGVLPMKSLEDFVAYCKLGAKLFGGEANNTLLYKLFTAEPDTVDSAQYLTNDTICQFKIPLANHLAYLQTLLPERCEDTEIEIRKIWYDIVNKFTISLLIHVFKFDLSVKEGPTHKSQKIDGQADIHDKNIVDSVTFTCVGNINLWEARKSIARDIPNDPTKSLLDNQIAVTNYICDVLYKGSRFKEPIVKFVIDLNATINPTEMHFSITNSDSQKGCFKTMALYFAKRIPQLIDGHIQELKKKSAPIVVLSTADTSVTSTDGDAEREVVILTK